MLEEAHTHCFIGIGLEMVGRQKFLLAFILLSIVGVGAVPDTAAQSSEEATAFLQAVEMRVHVTHAPVYAAPHRNAEVVRTLAWNERLLVLGQAGSFYRVVHPEGGPQGYVMGGQLRPTSHPLHRSEQPEELRRQERYVGARFDLQGGVALPYASESFTEGYRPGLDVGARLSYPIAGPLGMAVRFSYRQFGHSDGTARALDLRRIDLRGRALSMLTGAAGLDLTMFRGRWVAFVATVDGGIYHLAVDDGAVPGAHNPFGTASSAAWGGSVAARMSLRLGAALRLFVEPSYEVIRAPSGDVRFVPVRIGLSIER